MKKNLKIVLLGACASLFASAANAEITEARFGVMYHNLGVVRKQAGKEKGPDVAIQVAFNKIQKWKAIGKPRPIVTANINTRGETSFAAAGLNWHNKLSKNWAFEPSFGLAIHNADPLTNPYPPNMSAERYAFSHEKLALGSRELFWTSFAFSRKIGDDKKVFITYEHLSNGQILHHGANEGLDNIGLMFAKTF